MGNKEKAKGRPETLPGAVPGMSVREKAAWLKGLAEGLELDMDRKESRLLSAMLDVIGEMAQEVHELRQGQAVFSDALDSVSGDLEEMESILFGDADGYGEAESGHYAAVCPNCQETVYFDESVLEGGQVTCPGCGHRLEFDLKEEEA